jgi:hypothetical protein
MKCSPFASVSEHNLFFVVPIVLLALTEIGTYSMLSKEEIDDSHEMFRICYRYGVQFSSIQVILTLSGSVDNIIIE